MVLSEVVIRRAGFSTPTQAQKRGLSGAPGQGVLHGPSSLAPKSSSGLALFRHPRDVQLSNTAAIPWGDLRFLAIRSTAPFLSRLSKEREQFLL